MSEEESGSDKDTSVPWHSVKGLSIAGVSLAIAMKLTTWTKK